MINACQGQDHEPKTYRFTDAELEPHTELRRAVIEAGKGIGVLKQYNNQGDRHGS